MLLHWKPENKPQAGFTLVELVTSIGVFAIAIAGVIEGYVQANRMATYASYSLAAQSIASEGMEQARGAQWNELGGLDQWPAMTNGATNICCTLDVPSTGQPICVTNTIRITTISTTPPLRMIRSDCFWTFALTGQLCSNTVITYRAPDQ